MAVGAIKLYRWQQTHDGFAHLPTVIGRRSAEEAKLRYWDLIYGLEIKAGYWSLTEAGINWAQGRTRLPRYVRVYDGKALSPPQHTSRSGKVRPPVGIRDALGNRFDYDQLMRGEA